MRYDLMLQRLADKANRWEEGSFGSHYRKRVQVKTLADLRAIGDELAGSDQARYTVGNREKSIEEISELTDSELNEIQIITYPASEDPLGFDNSIMSFLLTNSGQSATVPGRFYMSVNANFSNLPDGPGKALRIKRVKEVAEACTRTVPWWKANARYPVVRTISKATAEQRAHDRKIRWQSAWLSFAVSAPVAVFCAWLTAALTPG